MKFKLAPGLTLSNGQVQVLIRLLCGYTSKKIGEELDLHYKTVATHIVRLREKYIRYSDKSKRQHNSTTILFGYLILIYSLPEDGQIELFASVLDSVNEPHILPWPWVPKSVKYKKAYDILIEYWDSLPDEAKPEIHSQLKSLNL